METTERVGMRILAIGDIHGAYKALMQYFKRSKFDYKKDRLIVMAMFAKGIRKSGSALMSC
jgi:hypothetical protein